MTLTLKFLQNDAIEDPIERLQTTKIVYVEHVPFPEDIMPPADLQEISRTAIHEAGHALIYLLYHRRFIYASIRLDAQEDSGGRVVGPITTIGTNIAVAGMAATLMLDGEVDLADGSCDEDINDFIEGAKDLGINEGDMEFMADAFKFELQSIFEQLVGEVTALKALTQELLEKDFLTYRQATLRRQTPHWIGTPLDQKIAHHAAVAGDHFVQVGIERIKRMGAGYILK